jgi:hypothetical protein
MVELQVVVLWPAYQFAREGGGGEFSVPVTFKEFFML